MTILISCGRKTLQPEQHETTPKVTMENLPDGTVPFMDLD